MYEILRRAHKHVLRSPSPPRVDFRNLKTIRDKLVRSTLTNFMYTDVGTNICGHSNCDMLEIRETTVNKEKYCINFLYDCNSFA